MTKTCCYIVCEFDLSNSFLKIPASVQDVRKHMY